MEQAPQRAVAGVGDVVAVGREEEHGLTRLRPVGKGGAFLHQRLVHDGRVGDEDNGAARDGDGDDGAVAGPELLELRRDVEQGFVEQEEVSDQREGRRSRWELLLVLRFDLEEEGDEDGDGDGEEDCIHGLHSQSSLSSRCELTSSGGSKTTC